jgi:transcriptional regulator with GAF, ATPase, and Fis domain
MRELFTRLARVAVTNSTVLVQGETGTGKELVANAIHQASTRSSEPFVIVDCAALPESLLEAELFGHAKGAFTGAVGSRAGALESAGSGTVFLDEIGELPLSVQPKLLRAIESRTVRRIGESAYRTVDVRFICATHRDLRTMVNAGAFREDLYFRLAVVPINVPPLRDRLDDIPLLVQRFLPEGAPSVMTPELARELASRPWLGNVRELRNFVERALALGPTEALALTANGQRLPPRSDAYPAVAVDVPFKVLRDRWLCHLEREYLRTLLAQHGRNISATATAAGLDRAYVHRLMRKHDL